MRSVVALIVAVGMVVGALSVRDRILADGGDAPLSPLSPDEPLQLVCVPELKAACEAMAGDGVVVVTEEAGVTAAALASSAGSDEDLWELSLTADDAQDLLGVGSDVEAVVGEMESLRQALEETHRPGQAVQP